MRLPSSTEYKDAIQHPHLCFADTDLRGCEPYPGTHGLPWHSNGNFAAVFRLRCPQSGKQWAVKCFTHADYANRGVRYLKLKTNLYPNGSSRPRKVEELVDFDYVAQGIRVRGTWYPVLKMAYVDDERLDKFVERHLGNKQAIAELAALWLRLGMSLRRAKVAHGDLHHGNVKVVREPRGGHRLKLLDYDGMYIKSLAHSPPGECGHENYQHPTRRKSGAYNAEIDRFPHLVIYTTLLCLGLDAGPSLWAEFNNGENLLFREDDFERPEKSELFKRLMSLGGQVRTLVGRLALACEGPLEQVPLVEDLVFYAKYDALTTQEEWRLKGLFPSVKKASSPTPSAKPWWAGRTSSYPRPLTQAAPVTLVCRPVAAPQRQTPPPLPRKSSWARRALEYGQRLGFGRWLGVAFRPGLLRAVLRFGP